MRKTHFGTVRHQLAGTTRHLPGIRTAFVDPGFNVGTRELVEQSIVVNQCPRAQALQLNRQRLYRSLHSCGWCLLCEDTGKSLSYIS